MKRKNSKNKPLLIEKEMPPKVKNPDIKWIILLVALAIISYGLSLADGYALDDFIVFVKNRYVQQGFGGMVNILTKDTFSGMSEANIMVLKGGRYRPLSLISFAIENQFFGTRAIISHGINVAVYAFIGVLLFKFLSHITTSLYALLGTCVLFITQPMHCESVINVKGRDDLMCFLFFLLTAIYLFRFLKTNSYLDLVISAVWFFLCTLSKETSIVFVAVFPLLIYFFTSASVKKNISISSLYLSVVLLFLLIRYLATKNNPDTGAENILNNPFLNANFEQHYSTILLTWLIYLKLLLLPILFSYDYNYNQIPLTTFSDWRVILSLFIHIALVVIAIIFFKRKSIYSFAILFYFITFSIPSNLFFNIGTPIAERFMLIPSLGFCLAMACFFVWIKEKLNSNALFIGIISCIALLYCMRNINRCPDWKDNETLFIADANTATQSTKVQLNAGMIYLKLSKTAESEKRNDYIKQAMIYLQRGIKIAPFYADGYLNMGVGYNWLGNYDSAEVYWNKARTINPANPTLIEYDKILSNYFFRTGLQKGTEKNFSESIRYMRRALRYDSSNAMILSNLGGAYYTIQKMDTAKYFWQKTLSLNPNDADATNGMRAIGK